MQVMCVCVCICMYIYIYKHCFSICHFVSNSVIKTQLGRKVSKLVQRSTIIQYGYPSLSARGWFAVKIYGVTYVCVQKHLSYTVSSTSAFWFCCSDIAATGQGALRASVLCYLHRRHDDGRLNAT